MGIVLNTSVFLFLAVAVVSDIRAHRISNALVLAGGLCALLINSWFYGFPGVLAWLMGLGAGLLLFLPFYALAGMAAGDVKLMAMVGGFIGPSNVFWAAAFSLMVGSLLGLLILFYRKQLVRTLQRYWVIVSLKTYIEPAATDAARQRFPYAIAILLGSLMSVCLNLSGAGA